MTEKQQREHAEQLEKWAVSGKEGTPPVLAATVILLRDAADGLETLMLRRNSKISFGGMWVFPGGHSIPRIGTALPKAMILRRRGSRPRERRWKNARWAFLRKGCCLSPIGRRRR